MTIEWFRDLSIVIFALVSVAVLVFMAVMAYSLYCHIRQLLVSIKVTSTALQGISESLGGRWPKLVQMTAVADGVSKGIEIIANIMKMKKGGGNVQQG